MELVGSALGDEQNLGAWASLQISRIRRGLNTEFPNGVNRRDKRNAVLVRFDV